MLVSRYLDAAANRFPHDAAVVFGDRQLTYDELRCRAVSLAHALTNLARRGALVGILCDNRIEYVECFYGVPAAGMLLTPLNQRLSRSELARIIAHSGVRVLITERRYLPKVTDAEGRWLPGLDHVVCVDFVDHAENRPWTRYEDLVGSVATRSWPDVAIGDRDAAWLVYTSGTTGMPKGVVLNHRNLDAVVANYLLGVPMRVRSAYLMPFPLCHVGGHVVFACAAVGARLVIQKSFQADEFVELVMRHGLETSPLAPTMLATLLTDGRDCSTMSSLRTVIYGSSGISVELLRLAMDHLPAVDFIGGYGMSETAGTVTWLAADEHRRAVATGDDQVLRSCGRPAPLVDVRIVDERLADCPVGTWGEVAVRGDQVMDRYWGDPAASAEVLCAGWLLTGDIGYFDGEGLLYLVDRKKDLVITGGENVSSREVEDVIVDHPAVAEAAIVGVPDPVWGQRVVAFVVPVGDIEIDEATIIKHCRSRLASFKKPSRVHFVSTLPRNALGKILKAQLRADALNCD